MKMAWLHFNGKDADIPKPNFLPLPLVTKENAEKTPAALGVRLIACLVTSEVSPAIPTRRSYGAMSPSPSGGGPLACTVVRCVRSHPGLRCFGERAHAVNRRVHQIPWHHKSGRVRRAAGFHHIDNVPTVDADDARLVDELQSKIDGR